MFDKWSREGRVVEEHIFGLITVNETLVKLSERRDPWIRRQSGVGINKIPSARVVSLKAPWDGIPAEDASENVKRLGTKKRHEKEGRKRPL